MNKPFGEEYFSQSTDFPFYLITEIKEAAIEACTKCLLEIMKQFTPTKQKPNTRNFPILGF